MISVQGIGMSGYVPLEGVIGLSHFYFNRFSGECVYKFKYLLGSESRETSGFDVMLRVVSFAIFNRFDEYAQSIILRDIGLLFGYHRAGVLFPMKLFEVFEDLMGLKDYGNWAYMFPHTDYRSSYSGYGFGEIVYTTAWAEYISVDFMKESLETAPLFLVQMLGRFEMPLPTFRCDELREELMR
jgi:hypothetical protein